jgi:hypothetical protein
MITQFDIEKLPSFELGMERGLQLGMKQIVKQLLKRQAPEVVAEMTDLPLEIVVAINSGKDGF